MFQLSYYRASYNNETYTWETGAATTVENFATLADLKRAATLEHGVPMAPFSEGRTSYTFHNDRWTWTEISDLAGLEKALDMAPVEIATALEVHLRTVRRWIAGSNKPGKDSLAKLKALANRVHQEVTAASRLDTIQDRRLRGLHAVLMTPAERAEEAADRDRMRAAFGIK